MKALYKWEECHTGFFEHETDAFYLEIPKWEITEELLNILVTGGRYIELNDSYFGDVNLFVESNPGLANKNCAYVLIDKDITKAVLCPGNFPYSSQWNGYCPLECLYGIEGIEITKLEDIKNINGIKNTETDYYAIMTNGEYIIYHRVNARDPQDNGWVEKIAVSKKDVVEKMSFEELYSNLDKLILFSGYKIRRESSIFSSKTGCVL